MVKLGLPLSENTHGLRLCSCCSQQTSKLIRHCQHCGHACGTKPQAVKRFGAAAKIAADRAAAHRAKVIENGLDFAYRVNRTRSVEMEDNLHAAIRHEVADRKLGLRR